ncbi:MAG: hypothetical protein IJI37_04930, partial [Opitutales bacterium]|nr:hypothetical protein [Opitutales bacterium]
MKKSQNFLLPLIALDALVFLFVGCAALPAALRGHAISGWLAFACVILLLAAMAAMLAPYVLEYKKDIAAKHEHTEEARKNFEIIFDELAALRLALADLVERVEKDEDNAPDRQKTERDILELKASAKENSAKNAEFKASVEDALSKLESSQKNAKAALDGALAEIESKIKDSESAADAKLEKCGAALAEIEKKIKSSELSGSKKFEEFGADLAEIKAQIAELSAALSAKEEAPQEPPAEPRRPKVEVGHLLRRALQNAEESKRSVEKFLSRNQEIEAAQAEENPEDDLDGAEGTIDFSDDVPPEGEAS